MTLCGALTAVMQSTVEMVCSTRIPRRLRRTHHADECLLVSPCGYRVNLDIIIAAIL